MNIRTIQTIEEFKALRPAWNRLIDVLEQSEPFYYWEWANAHIEHRFSESDELLIIVIEHGKELLAVAPLCLQKERIGPFSSKVLRTLTGDHADYGSFYLHPERNQRLLLKKIFIELFARRDRWDALHLLNFNSRNPQSFLINELVQSEFEVSSGFGEQIITPYINLGRNDETIGRKNLREIDRCERNLLKNHEVEIKIEAKFTEELWDRLIELHIEKWPTSVFRCPHNRAFFRQVIQDFTPENKVSFSWMTIDGEIAAIDFGFQIAKKRLAYMPVYDAQYHRYSLGGIMIKHLLAHYRSSMEVFDLMRGNEPYKFEWTDLATANHNLLIDNGRQKGRAICRFIQLKDKLRRISWINNLTQTLKGVLRSDPVILPECPTEAWRAQSPSLSTVTPRRHDLEA